MKISAIVAGMMRIKRPASRLSMKLVKEGVMKVSLGWAQGTKRILLDLMISTIATLEKLTG